MIPSEWAGVGAGRRAGRRRSGSTRRPGRRRRPRAGRGPGRRAAAGRRASSGRGGARCRPAAHRPRRGPPTTGERARRRVRMGERRGVHHDAGHQGRGQAPRRPRPSGTPSRAASSVDHLAGRGRPPGRSSRPVAGRVVRGVVVDDDPRQRGEQVGVAPADLTDPVERAAVRHDQQVVVDVRVGIGPDGLDAGQEVVQRPATGRCRRGRPVRRGPRRSGRRRATAPSVSASGFSWLTARTRRAPRDPLDDGGRDASERPAGDDRPPRSSVAAAWRLAARRRPRWSGAARPDRGGGRSCRPAAARDSGLGCAWWRGRPASAATRRGGASASARSPVSISSIRWRTRVPRSIESRRGGRAGPGSA